MVAPVWCLLGLGGELVVGSAPAVADQPAEPVPGPHQQHDRQDQVDHRQGGELGGAGTRAASANWTRNRLERATASRMLRVRLTRTATPNRLWAAVSSSSSL
jgi:hypothetical protein